MGGCYGWLLWGDADWCLQSDTMTNPRLRYRGGGGLLPRILGPLHASWPALHHHLHLVRTAEKAVGGMTATAGKGG